MLTPPNEQSPFELAAERNPEGLRRYVDSLDAHELDLFSHDWKIHGRPKQQIPLGNWDNWLCLSGRGWG
jgi:hypothetical protein